MEDAKSLANKENLFYFETSARTGEGIKYMLYSSLSELPYFEQFKEEKEKIISELEEGNKDNYENLPTDVILPNENKIIVNNQKSEKSDEKKSSCKC